MTGLEDPLPERHLTHPAYRRSLKRAGFESVLDFLYGDRADVVRDRGDRANARLTIAHGGEEITCYLKRHQPLSITEGIEDLLVTGKILSPGMRECANAAILRRIGIDTVPVIAAGEEHKPFHKRRSYFLSHELEGAEPLDDFFRTRFGPETQTDRAALRAKRAIIDLAARTAQRFHAAGCHHQDFYLCHFFIGAHAADAGADFGADVRLFLIDLQRMRRRRRLARRWIVKDLAQLNYSADATPLSRTDRLRFFLAYLNAGRLLRPHRRLLRAILRKTARIARHDRKGK